MDDAILTLANRLAEDASRDLDKPKNWANAYASAMAVLALLEASKPAE